jgi:hypothetical protein
MKNIEATRKDAATMMNDEHDGQDYREVIKIPSFNHSLCNPSIRPETYTKTFL